MSRNNGTPAAMGIPSAQTLGLIFGFLISLSNKMNKNSLEKWKILRLGQKNIHDEPPTAFIIGK